jgi:fatty acid desaturase
VLIGYAVSIYSLIVQDSIVQVVIWSVIFSACAVQLAGLVHDSGHRAIFKSNRANDLLGRFVASIIAMRYDSWRTKHNKHHSNTNEDGEDPDFSIPLLAFSEAEYLRKRGIGKLLRKHQVFFYFPIGLLLIFSTRIRSIREYATDYKWKSTWEFAIFVVVFASWFVLPFVFFPLGKAITIFSVVNAVTGLYLFTIFAPNHKGMPKLENGVKISFFERQVMTSRDIRSNWLTDLLYLGLNNQVEHHLFANCPRNKLHLLIPLVKAASEQAGLEYTSVGIIRSNRIILGELHGVTKARVSTPAPSTAPAAPLA